MTQSRQTALITGASSGIGTELARLLAAGGHDLLLVARRAERLEQLAGELRAAHGIDATVLVRDLALPMAGEQLWDEVKRTGRSVDVLVNSAGMATTGAFTAADARATETMMQLNMVALTMLTRCALPDMLERRHGRILNVASLAGFQAGGPGMAVYFATKSYVLSFTRALARELRGSGVTVTALCPGPTHTEMEDLSGIGRLRLFRWVPPMDARSVAAAGLRALHTGRVIEVPGFLNKLLAIGGELPPRRIGLEVNRWLLQ